MDAKILRKWGLKAVEADTSSMPSSPTSLVSVQTLMTAEDYNALREWLPPIPRFERQRLSAPTLLELKSACALILKDTAPDDADLDQTDPLEEYKKSVARAEKPGGTNETANSTANAPEVTNEQRSASQRKDSQKSSKKHKPYKQSNVPIGVAATGERVEYINHVGPHPVQIMPSFPQPPRRVESGSTVPSTRERDSSQLHLKPHTAASNDYVVNDSNPRSRVTSRITTAYASQNSGDNRSSSGNLSYEVNPNPNPNPNRISDVRASSAVPWEAAAPISVPDRPGSSLALRGSNMWIAQERGPEEEIQVLPQVHKSTSMVSLRSANGLRSRAESLRDSIRGYVRPSSRSNSRPPSRPATSHGNHPFSSSFDASRPESQPRPTSRSSIASTGHNRSWWHGAAGALRRKGSFNSYRSTDNYSAPNLTEQIAVVRDPVIDTNKDLPPMPSLDTYVEPKIHISQLMVTQPAPAPPQNSMITSPVEAASPVEPHPAPTIHTVISPTVPHANFPAPPRQPSLPRQGKSPALTPASENAVRQSKSMLKARMSYFHTDRESRDDRDKDSTAAHSDDLPPPIADVRTFYSPAHQTASTNLVQFSDEWRQELAEKDLERRRRHELAWQRKKEERRLEAERRKTMMGKPHRERLPGLKNRLSKMFGGGGGGAAAHLRGPPPHHQPVVREDNGGGVEDGHGGDRAQEVTVAY